jgi:hypothetical protein
MLLSPSQLTSHARMTRCCPLAVMPQEVIPGQTESGFGGLRARLTDRTEALSESEIDHFVMAITAAEAMVRHIAPRQRAWAIVLSRLHGRTQMRKITLFAVAAAVIATGFGVWAAAPTNARVPSTSQGIEPFQPMMNAKGLPTAEPYDHGFVFH